MKVYIKRDQQERISFKHRSGKGGMRPRVWFASAWRLVDGSGQDWLYPWADSRKEAREYAQAAGWEITGQDR